jgi:hypothetical protein
LERRRWKFLPVSVKRREQFGLPENTQGRVRFVVAEANLSDRKAAESWPEGLDCNADLLPMISNGTADCELAAAVAAGILSFNGPTKLEEEVGVILKLSCSAFELVCWRRAWRAERRALAAEKELAKYQAQPDDEV